MKLFKFLFLLVGGIGVTFSTPLAASTLSVGQVLRDQIPISRTKSILLPPGSWQVEAFFETTTPLTGGSRSSQPIKNIVLINTDHLLPVSTYVASWSEFADVTWGGNDSCNLEGNLKPPYVESFGTTLSSPTVRCVTGGKFVNFRSIVSNSSSSSNTFVKSNLIHLTSKSAQLPLHALVLSGSLRRVRGDRVSWWIYIDPVGAGLSHNTVDRNILNAPLGLGESQSITANPLNLVLNKYFDWNKDYLLALEAGFYPSLFGGAVQAARRTGLPPVVTIPSVLPATTSSATPRPLSEVSPVSQNSVAASAKALPESPAVASLSTLRPCPKNTELRWSSCVGSMTYGDGAKYVGEWLDDAYHGLGIYYRSDGTVIRSGRWNNSTFVQHIDLEKNNFPFNQISPEVTAAKIESDSAERDRLIAEAETARIRQQELEQKLTLQSQERERQAAEGEAARRRQQELEQRLAVAQERERQNAEAEATSRKQQELEQRLATEARERERQAAEADAARLRQKELEQRLATEAREREKQAAEAEAARSKQQELEQRLATDAREREKQAAEVEAVRRRQQELEAQLAALQSQAASRPPNQAASSRNQRRVALVIGNAQYKVSPLDNPVNDATDMDRTLKQLGFQTTLLRNATLGQMREATRRFADQLQSADVALIYFAGHGVESNRKNYMIPVNADLKFEYELDDQAYNAGQWLDMLESIKSSNAERVNIVILDACRNNSLIGARSLGRGLGRMDAPTGTFLAYSTAPGKVAADGARGERNSPFTRHLLTAMQQPGLPIEEAFKEVRRNVSRETNGAQVPWESTSLTGFFTFRQTR